MKPSDFNKVEDWPIGLGMGKFEYEHFAAYVLYRHVVANQPFDQPFQYKYDHSDMVAVGWLADHGDKKYTLTPVSLGLLHKKYGKKP